MSVFVIFLVMAVGQQRVVCQSKSSAECVSREYFEHQFDNLKEGLKSVELQLQTLVKTLGSPVPASHAFDKRQLSSQHVRDCADVMSLGMKTSGVYTVYVGIMKRPVQVYCDMTTDGGGWTVFQRRQDGSVDFYRKWADYETGFGTANGEYWLGNDNLYRMTSVRQYQLRVDLRDWYGNARYAEYSKFKVGSACEKYKLVSLGAYCGTAGDSMTAHVGHKFTANDQDNDSCVNINCAVLYKGAWWYTGGHHSNLNALYRSGPTTSFADSVNWYAWTGYHYSLKFTEMKIRPVDM